MQRTVNVEETSSKAMVAIDGAGFDWSYMTDDEVHTNIALISFSDSEVHNDKTCSKTCLKSFETLKTQLDDLRIELIKSEFNLATYKRGLVSIEKQLVFYKKNEVIFYQQLAVLKRDISYKDSELSMLKSELEKLKQEKESNQLKIENFDNASKSLDKLIGSQITDKSRKGVGFVSYNAIPPPHTGLFSPLKFDLSNSGLEEFQQPEFEGYGPQTSESVSEDISNEVRESPDAPLVEELVSDDKLEKKIIFPTVAKIVFVRPKQQDKPVRKSVKERVVSGNNYTRVNNNYSAKQAHPSTRRNIVPRVVLMKTSLRPLNTAMPVNTAHPKTTVYSARPMSHFSKSAQSTVKRPYQIRTALTNKNFSQKVNTAKGKFYTARPKAVNTARPNLAVVNAVRENQVNAVKASACWGHPQKEDQGYVDSGCSRHMTGNMSYLSDFKEFDGGYVTFGGGAKGGKITSKGTLKTGKLDFEDVYFVKELQFNLFSVSQMCDKKNSVLFTNTRCFVLSPDFKLADESQATLDESMLWHRRLGHVNFKTINKLGKENLVRGLPSKHFENDQTCVACLKGKQDKAFCRTPALSFMRPFGCHVTILNTLDYLGKFDGKSNEGFFIGYLMNKAMQEELLQFKLQQVWTLVDLPHGKRAIGTKWVYRNKKDERVARIEAIRLFLAYASFKDFVVYQMDVKSAFLYGKVEEEVYVCQPLGFKDPEFLYKLYKVQKALYGLHQAPRACVKVIFNKFKYDVDDIIFGSLKKGVIALNNKYTMKTSKPLMKDENAKDVNVHLYRSMIGSLMHLTSSRPDIIYMKGQPKLGLWYPKDSSFDLEAYTDSDYAGASLDRKSTTGGCQFLGSRLISWQCKKQTIVANSTTEAESVATASCCGQVLWIQNQMLEYGYNFMNTKIFIDNESTICIVKNLVFYSKTKHIEIRHHFIRDSNEKKLIQMIKIHTNQNVADLLTKAFDNGTTANDEIQVRVLGLTYYRTGKNEAIAVICHAINQRFNFSKYIFDNIVKNLKGGVKFLMYPREMGADEGGGICGGSGGGCGHVDDDVVVFVGWSSDEEGGVIVAAVGRQPE
ncbi:ribonuclease H-like domain-containing protein [Tanacetum coccineum]